MTDNESNSKFNLGDNSDGYTRSVSPDGPNYSFDNDPRQITWSNLPNEETRTAAPTPKPRPRQTPPQQRKRPQSPLPKAPSVRQKELNRRYTPQPGQRPVERPRQNAGVTRSEQNRHHSIQRRRQTQQKRLISYILIAFIVLGAMVALSLTVLFPISDFVVTGSGHYANEQIIAASGLEKGENIILCKKKPVSGLLAKALPYVGHAEVKWSLSGKLTIVVTETAGKYAVLSGEQCVILDETGKVLEIAANEEAVKYTVVISASVKKPVPGEKAEFSGAVSLEKLLQVGNALKDASIDKATSIDLTNMSNVVVSYDARLTLELGTLSGLDRKLALARRVISRENELNPTQYGTINLSIEGKAYFSETMPEAEPEEETEPGEANPGEANPDGANPDEAEPEETTAA